MTPDTRFSINTARFAHETVDGEVIIIDMDEGNYFSLRNSAALTWGLLDHNMSLGEVESALAAAAGTRDVGEPVRAFVQRLLDEHILTPRMGAVEHPGTITVPTFAFIPPVLEKYTEMQDLLTLDPIHDVDESGWPNRAETAND
jgi:hypothetical protein